MNRIRTFPRIPWALRLLAALLIGWGMAALLFTNRGEILRLGGWLVLLQVGSLALPLALLASLPELIRHRRPALAALGSTLISLLAVHLLGPVLLGRFILPLYQLDLDHRPKPRPGVTNRDGVAPDRPPEAFRREDWNVIVLGDSFTFGLGVRPEDAFPILLEGLLQAKMPDRTVRVANFGWVSASPVLQGRQLRQIGAAYQPDLVIQAFDMTDFIDDLRYRRRLELHGYDRPMRISFWRALEVRLGGLVGEPNPLRWYRRQLPFGCESSPEGSPSIPDRRFFHLFQPLEDSRPWLEPTWETILDIRQQVRQLEAGYALFLLPRYQQYDRRECPGDHEADEFPDSDEYILEPLLFFQEKAREADFPIHSLRADFRTCGVFPTVQPGDPHYNEAGHWVVARAMARYLEADRLLDQ